MRHTRAFRALAAALVISAVAFAVAGCTGEPPRGPVKPGTKSAALGGMEVVGYLRSDAKGTLTVFDSKAASGTVEPKALATLVPGSIDEHGIEVLVGRYIWAAGRASSSKGLPLIRVDGIDLAQEP